MMRISSNYRKINYKSKPVPKAVVSKSSWRLHLVKYTFWIVAFGLFLRLVQIQILDSSKYAKLGEEQYTSEYTQKAPRGFIRG